MSRRLLQLVIPVTPERRMFRINDPAVDPDAPGAPVFFNVIFYDAQSNALGHFEAGAVSVVMSAGGG